MTDARDLFTPDWEAVERQFQALPNCRCVPTPIFEPLTTSLQASEVQPPGWSCASLRVIGPFKEAKKKEKLVKVRNKFYVASPAVTTASEQDQVNDPKDVRLSVQPTDRGGKWTRKDLASAVAHATQLLRDDPNKDHVAVVRIVKIVRRKEAPVIVETV